jgi:hypothetical protein
MTKPNRPCQHDQPTTLHTLLGERKSWPSLDPCNNAIRVRGNAKVMCHLMFGIVALAADQILRLIT